MMAVRLFDQMYTCWSLYSQSIEHGQGRGAGMNDLSHQNSGQILIGEYEEGGVPDARSYVSKSSQSDCPLLQCEP